MKLAISHQNINNLYYIEGAGEDVKYPWVGLNRKGGGVGDAGLSKAEEHARELFMTAQTDSVAIGGG